MKTILKKLNCDSHEIIYRMVNNGEEFVYKDGAMRLRLHYDKHHRRSPFRLDGDPWNWRGLKHLHEEIEQPWYEDPEAFGKVCHFWNTDIDKERLILGKFIGGAEGRHTSSDGNIYKHARPLTEDDLYKGDV